MATAKRIAQNAKVEGEIVRAEATDYRVYTVDGKEVERVRLSVTDIAVLDNRRIIPQPDRIVLEMNVEEATTIQIIRARIGGHPDGRRGDLDSISRALRSAGVPDACFHPDVESKGGDGLWLKTTRTPASPLPGTQASPVKDTACGKGTSDRNPVYPEPYSLLR